MNLTAADIAKVNMDPGVTPLQGRVVFHQERLFRSTGTGEPAHRRFLGYAAAEGLPISIPEMSRRQCVRALELIERACRMEGMQLFRDVNTSWRELQLWEDVDAIYQQRGEFKSVLVPFKAAA